MVMHRTWTVVHDDREKYPLKFPDNLVTLNPESGKRITIQIKKQRRRMPFADYYLLEDDGGMRIERKYTLDEIASNCTTVKGRANFKIVLEKLQLRSRAPVLLLEGSHQKFLTPTQHQRYPGPVLDALFDLLTQYNIQLETMSGSTINARRTMGEWVLRRMIRSAINKPYPLFTHTHFLEERLA